MCVQDSPRMIGVRAIAHGPTGFALLVFLLGCGLELEGTGGRSEPFDPVGERPTDDVDASVHADDAALAPEPEGPSDDVSSAPSPDAGATCSLTGRFAMKLEFDVDWQATSIGIGITARPLVAAGSGTMVVYTAAEVRAEGDALVATLSPCGAEIPDFRSGSVFSPSDVYGVYVSDMAWESGAMPRWDVTWRPDCTDPGCTMRSAPFEGWIGAQQAPLDALRGELDPVDVDGDGNAGITLLTRRSDEHTASGQPYTQPPIDVTRTNPFRAPSRAHDVMLALGMRMHFDGEVRSCDLIEGASDAGSLRVVAFGCTSEEGTSLSSCPPAVARVVDAKLPTWQVRGARYRTERVHDDRCEAVRARFRQPG